MLSSSDLSAREGPSVGGRMSGFTIASLKNAVDELRVQYYPKNETEKRVIALFIYTVEF